MSLIQGMPISSIVEHLGVRFVITLQPQEGKFYLERLLEAQGVAHHDLEPHVEPVTIEFDDVQGLLRGWRTRRAVAG